MQPVKRISDGRPGGTPIPALIEASSAVQEAAWIQATALADEIKRDLAAAATLLLEAGAKLAEAQARKVWEPLSYSSFVEWVELDLHIGKSWAYDLIRLNTIRLQDPAAAARMIQIGVSKMRIVLHHLELDKQTGAIVTAPERMEELFTQAETLPVEQLGYQLNNPGVTYAPPNIWRECPCCRAQLNLSRACDILSGIPAKEIRGVKLK